MIYNNQKFTHCYTVWINLWTNVLSSIPKNQWNHSELNDTLNISTNDVQRSFDLETRYHYQTMAYYFKK